MTFFELSVLFGSSILVAGTLGIIRYNKIKSDYYPFLYLIWIGCLNEIISYLLVINNQYTIVNGIIYGLCESLLLLWFFSNLGLFNKRRFLLIFLISLFIGIWIIDTFFSKAFGSAFNSYFSVVYSLSIVLLGIHAINGLLFKEREILKNPAFLICTALVVYFTYKVVIEIFWLYGLRESKYFRNNVYFILIYINLLCNLIYALAILWMRKKQPFTLQF